MLADEHRRQVRQPGADDDHRQPRLADLVAGRAQRGDVVGAEVLHLVDEDRDALADVGGQPADVGEQLDQVDLDVAGVGPALHGGHVDAGLHWSRSLASAPASRWAKDLITPSTWSTSSGLRVAELAHRLVQRAGQRPAQPLVGAGLELAGAPAACGPPPSAAR